MNMEAYVVVSQKTTRELLSRADSTLHATACVPEHELNEP